MLCTIIILLFTVLLELAVHSPLSCYNPIKEDADSPFDTTADTTSQEALLPTTVVEQPQPQPTPDVDTPQPRVVYQDVERPEKKFEDIECCHPNPTPNVRANRFIAAVLLYAVVLTAFIILIHDIDGPYIRPECPNWWTVALLNILPFVTASFSLIRTVVDCLLVRWRQGLSYHAPTGDDAWRMWPPCVPFYIVFVGLYSLVEAMFGWPITLLKGRPRSSVWSAPRNETRREDIEMQDEEMRGLIDNVDGEGERAEEEGSRDGPPAYDEAVHQMQKLVEGRKGSANVV